MMRNRSLSLNRFCSSTLHITISIQISNGLTRKHISFLFIMQNCVIVVFIPLTTPELTGHTKAYSEALCLQACNITSISLQSYVSKPAGSLVWLSLSHLDLELRQRLSA